MLMPEINQASSQANPKSEAGKEALHATPEASKGFRVQSASTTDSSEDVIAPPPHPALLVTLFLNPAPLRMLRHLLAQLSMVTPAPCFMEDILPLLALPWSSLCSAVQDLFMTKAGMSAAVP